MSRIRPRREARPVLVCIRVTSSRSAQRPVPVAAVVRVGERTDVDLLLVPVGVDVQQQRPGVAPDVEHRAGLGTLLDLGHDRPPVGGGQDDGVRNPLWGTPR